MGTKAKLPIRLNALLYVILLQELVDGATTREEMVEKTGLSYHTILGLVRAMHDRRLIHIAAWGQDAFGRHTVAAFSFGDKPDAKRPRRLTSTQLKRRHRERKAAAAMFARLSAAANDGQSREAA